MTEPGVTVDIQANPVPVPPHRVWSTRDDGHTVRAVVCPYCAEPIARMETPARLHIFEVHAQFDPRIEALHCDFASLPFDVLIHPDGTPEAVSQSDPRFVP